ncbi:C40 family peptidase [Marinobacterium rhizophilum]|uniref:C40 family peptidase n=1 Tax=Marinobacterium rhizophilum TaxID=420402 RepID=UPI0003643AAA|nr:NlpC/P60 family protein [Marinobacterium rhizophilum]
MTTTSSSTALNPTPHARPDAGRYQRRHCRATRGALVLLAGLCLALLHGCSGPVVTLPPADVVVPAETPSPAQNIVSRLYELHREWRGTPYLYGGTGRNGIDCSALIQHGFRTYFNQELPRTTEGLLAVGDTITAKQLRAGDLVFFKTGTFGRHAGIYIENGRFLHASTSQGVIISDMRNPYWKRHYWTARRIETPTSTDS